MSFIEESSGDYVAGGPWTAVLSVYAAVKTAVIKRDTGLLAEDKVSGLSIEVSAAVLEELTIWVKYKCFERRPRPRSARRHGLPTRVQVETQKDY